MQKKIPTLLGMIILIIICMLVIVLTYPGIKELYGASIKEYFAKSALEKNKKQCNSIGGFWTETGYGLPAKPRCIPPYTDYNTPCDYSNQCQGSCVAKNYTIKIPENCARLGDTNIFGQSHTENYSCPNIKFEGRCSKFKWERNPELNGNVISQHIEYYDL